MGFQLHGNCKIAKSEDGLDIWKRKKETKLSGAGEEDPGGGVQERVSPSAVRLRVKHWVQGMHMD